MEPTAEDMESIGWLVGLLGGIAGIGTALASGCLAIYRRGYRAGREAERRCRQERNLEQIAEHLNDP